MVVVRSSDPPVFGEIVYTAHLVVVFEEFLNKVSSDEPGRTCNKNFHLDVCSVRTQLSILTNGVA